MASSRIVKLTAKTALSGKWLNAFFASGIVIFASLILSNSMSVLSLVAGEIFTTISMVLISVFVISPLSLGLLRFFWRNLFDVKDNPISVFYYFSSVSEYKRILSLVLSIAFKLIFWGVLLYIPVLIVELMSHSFIYDIANMPLPVWTTNLTNLKTFLKILSGVLVGFAMLRFYLAPMLFIADDNIEAAEAMHMSTVISKKTSVDFIYFLLSFIGWIALSVLMLPLIFTLPYFITSYLVHSRFAVADYNKTVKHNNDNIFPSFTA